VVRIPEQGGTGYTWFVESIPTGSATVVDEVEIPAGLQPGGSAIRHLEIALGDAGGPVTLFKRREWEPADRVAGDFSVVVVVDGT